MLQIGLVPRKGNMDQEAGVTEQKDFLQFTPVDCQDRGKIRKSQVRLLPQLTCVKIRESLRKQRDWSSLSFFHWLDENSN